MGKPKRRTADGGNKRGTGYGLLCGTVVGLRRVGIGICGLLNESPPPKEHQANANQKERLFLSQRRPDILWRSLEKNFLLSEPSRRVFHQSRFLWRRRSSGGRRSSGPADAAIGRGAEEIAADALSSWIEEAERWEAEEEDSEMGRPGGLIEETPHMSFSLGDCYSFMKWTLDDLIKASRMWD